VARKKLTGTIVSDTSDKTVVVLVKRKKTHRLYGKAFTLSKKFHAHDEYNEYRCGDQVVIEEHRPISKLKSWIVLEKIN
jgi:small subunit ribosomal protein S17